MAVFIDGQNLYHRCKDHFGVPWVHPRRLAEELVRMDQQRYGAHSHLLTCVRYYTGIHDPNRRPTEHAKMSRRLAAYSAQGVQVFPIPVKYNHTGRAREKGVDVRLAIDLVRLARKGLFDVAIIISEDSDLDEAAQDVYGMRDHERWVAVENALPWSRGSHCRWLPSVKRRRPIKLALFNRVVDHAIY